MLLAAGSLLQFVKFIQITLLIILPLMAAAVAFTLYSHYRKKKKPVPEKNSVDPVLHLLNANPEVINYEDVEGDYVHFDQSVVVKEYKSKLIYSHARFMALQKDYEGLQDKCNSLLMILESNSLIQKTKFMKNHELQTGTPGFAISEVVTEDNQKLPGAEPGMDEACMRDLLEQKRTEIAFLQAQLEQRIRNFHHSEKQLAEARAHIDDADRKVAEARTAMENAISRGAEREAHIEKLNHDLLVKQQQLNEQEDKVYLLEDTFRSTREQNEMLNAQVADHNDLIQALQATLEAEEAKVDQLQDKLNRNRQIMKRLFNEFAQCMEPEQEASPVVELKAAFVKDQQEAFTESILP